MKTRKLSLASALILALTWTDSWSHPGALDKNACHKVTKDYKYIGSKKTLKAGTSHCHAGLDRMKLGSEMLDDPWDAGEEVKPQKTKGKPK